MRVCLYCRWPKGAVASAGVHGTVCTLGRDKSWSCLVFFSHCYCDLLFRSRPSSPPASASAWPLEMTSLQAWEMNGREGRAGQAKPSGARYGVAAVLGRELVDVQERWRRSGTSIPRAVLTYMPPPRASQPRAAARWHGTGKGNHNLEKCLDAGGLAAPQEAHLLVHTWHGGV